MLSAAIRDELEGGAVVAVVGALPKTFRKGSTGYYGQLRTTIRGEKFLLMVTAVRIGSGPVDLVDQDGASSAESEGAA